MLSCLGIYNARLPVRVQKMFPYLCVSDVNAAIDFYVSAFGATEAYSPEGADGRLGHAELEFGGGAVMLSDEFPEMDVKNASTLGGTPVTLYLRHEGADAVVMRARKLGALVESKVQDHFHGERSGAICDPFGHRWMIGTHIEDVSPEEMQRCYDEMTGDQENAVQTILNCSRLPCCRWPVGSGQASP